MIKRKIIGETAEEALMREIYEELKCAASHYYRLAIISLQELEAEPVSVRIPVSTFAFFKRVFL